MEDKITTFEASRISSSQIISMIDLVFATNNMHKLKEVQLLLPKDIRLLSLKDINCDEEIEETASTLEGNARIKADYITTNYGYPCFADDTGLIVDALGGAPGVFSARYAGEHKNAEDNINKLLLKLGDTVNRSARFITVIALNLNAEHQLFKGTVEGIITRKKFGTGGFGYDPIFKPLGYEQTFAQLPLSVKNKISHRGLALQQLISYLKVKKHLN